MVDAKVDHLFKSLSNIAKQLNSESDSVNATLEAFEEKLNALNLGIEVWVTERAGDPLIVTDPEGDSRRSTRSEAVLGYHKDLIHGWGLAVKWFEVEEWIETDAKEEYPRKQKFNPSPPMRLLEASRDLRIVALDKLPRLLEALEEKAQVTIASINQAKKTLKQ